MSSTPPGWHPDPQGRHQHRFWDGTNWTDQVADNGEVSTDPLNAAPAWPHRSPSGENVEGAQHPDSNDTVFGGAAGATPGSTRGGQRQGAPHGGGAAGFQGGPPPGPGGPPPGSPILPGSNTPPAPKSSSKLPLVIVGILVLVGVLIAGFLLLRGGGGGTADGDYKLTVKQGQVVVRKVKLKAGEALYVRVKGKNLRRALAIDAAVYKQYIDNKFINTDDSNQLSRFDGRGFYTDNKDLSKQLSGFDTGSAKFRYPGFGSDVLMLRSFVGGQGSHPFRGDAESVVAPIGGTYYIAIRATNGDQEARLSLRTGANPKVKKDLDTSQFDSLGTDFYTDFYSNATDQVDTAGS